MLGMISLDVKPSKNLEGKETKQSTKIGVRSTDPYSAQHFVNFKMERDVFHFIFNELVPRSLKSLLFLISRKNTC